MNAKLEALALEGKYRFLLHSMDGDERLLKIEKPGLSYEKAKKKAEEIAFEHWCSDGQRWWITEIA